MVTTCSGEINSHEIFREFGAEIWLELFVDNPSLFMQLIKEVIIYSIDARILYI